jgi:hypothetical protein
MSLVFYSYRFIISGNAICLVINIEKIISLGNEIEPAGRDWASNNALADVAVVLFLWTKIIKD